MSTSERKKVGASPLGFAATSRPAAFPSPADGEDWRSLINGLSAAVDELYSQHLFNNATERQQAGRDLLAQRLSQFRDTMISSVVESLRTRMDLLAPPDHSVEVTVLETQLQETQAKLRRAEETLETTHRESNRHQAENRRLQELQEKLQAQAETTRAENQRLQEVQEKLQSQAETARAENQRLQELNEKLQWQLETAQAENQRLKVAPARQGGPEFDADQTVFYHISKETRDKRFIAAPAEGAVFASVVRLARSCAGGDLVFDSEEQITGVFNRVGQTMETLLQAALKLIQGRWQFRTEFIGATVMHSAKSFALQTARSAGEVKKFIFAPEISDQEFAARQQLLKEAMDELMLHQLALLEGYRTCVNEGARKLLQVLDPAILTQKLKERNFKLGPWEIPLNAIPLLFQWHMLNYYKHKHADLIAEDRRIFEKKMFRPGFIRGYETRMASARPDSFDGLPEE